MEQPDLLQSSIWQVRVVYWKSSWSMATAQVQYCHDPSKKECVVSHLPKVLRRILTQNSYHLRVTLRSIWNSSWGGTFRVFHCVFAPAGIHWKNRAKQAEIARKQLNQSTDQARPKCCSISAKATEENRTSIGSWKEWATETKDKTGSPWKNESERHLEARGLNGLLQ